MRTGFKRGRSQILSGSAGAADTLRMAPDILVVDDEPAICELVATMLQNAGYRPIAASQPDRALELSAAGQRFALAILDLVMPLMGGEGLAARLRRDDPDLKVLYLTGYADILFQVRPILWENEAFLEKPFTEHGLLEGVSLLLYGDFRSLPDRAGDHANKS